MTYIPPLTYTPPQYGGDFLSYNARHYGDSFRLNDYPHTFTQNNIPHYDVTPIDESRLQWDLSASVPQEQAVIDNDVRGLNAKLAEISTQMQTILAQQKTLLDLRSKVEKSTTITDGLGDKLDIYQQEIDDIWKAYDSLAENPLQ